MPHKICLNLKCGAKSGVRANKCGVCHTPFSGQTTTLNSDGIALKPSTKTAELVLHGNIVTPRGACKIKPDGSSKDEVERWALNVYNWGKQTKRNFSIEAIQFFAQSFWEPYGKEYGPIREIIGKYLSNGTKKKIAETNTDIIGVALQN